MGTLIQLLYYYMVYLKNLEPGLLKTLRLNTWPCITQA